MTLPIDNGAEPFQGVVTIGCTRHQAPDYLTVVAFAQLMADRTNETWAVWQENGYAMCLPATHLSFPGLADQFIEPDNEWHRGAA